MNKINNRFLAEGMPKLSSFGRWLLIAGAAAVLLAVQQGSVRAAAFSITGSSGTYMQDFNSLGTSSGTWTNDSTLPSWFAIRTGTGTNITVGTGSSATGDLYNFGSASAVDRALGS